MKIAIITDTHFGIRSDSPIFLEYFESFFQNTFLPFLLKNNIQTVWHLGDWNDRRKFVSYYTLNFVRKRIVSLFEKHNIKIHLIIGNHDTYHKNTNDINSPSELLSPYAQVFDVITHPKELEFDGMKVLFVPWICDENREECIQAISKTKASICAGHFEITGFEVIRGTPFEDGLNVRTFDKFEMVFSGHFHCKQDDGHVYYLGTPYDHNYGDVFEKKGFHVFDTQTRELTFIENQDKLFLRLEYRENQSYEVERYTKKFVKVVVKEKKDPIKFDAFIESLNQAQPHDINIIDETALEYNQESDIIDETLDTVSIIASEIDSMEISDTVPLKALMHEIYTEAQDIEL